MKLNKLIVTFSSVLLVGTLAACGNKSAESQAQTSAHESSVVVKKSHKKSAIKAKAVLLKMQILQITHLSLANHLV